MKESKAYVGPPGRAATKAVRDIKAQTYDQAQQENDDNQEKHSSPFRTDAAYVKAFTKNEDKYNDLGQTIDDEKMEIGRKEDYVENYIQKIRSLLNEDLKDWEKWKKEHEKHPAYQAGIAAAEDGLTESEFEEMLAHGSGFSEEEQEIARAAFQMA